MLSALMGVQGEFLFATKMPFALLLLTPTSFGQVKFWWPGLFEMCLRSISWRPYAWWPWPWGQVVDLPQGQIKGDTLVSRAGLSYSAFRSSFHGKEKSSWVKNSQTTTRAISLCFKNHVQKYGQVHPIRLSTCGISTLGSSPTSACAWLGGHQEWKVAIKKYLNRPFCRRHSLIIFTIGIITIITIIISMAPPYCLQPMYDPPFFHGEEDCLYLNIFTSKVKDRDSS